MTQAWHVLKCHALTNCVPPAAAQLPSQVETMGRKIHYEQTHIEKLTH